MLNAKDKEMLSSKGISAEAIDEQLNRFKNGFPFLKINSVATVNNGIKQLSGKELNACLKAWKSFQGSNCSIEKFVPASGAASRMFKNVFAFVKSDQPEPDTEFMKDFFGQIDKFAFYTDLNKACKRLYEKDIHALITDGKYKEVAQAMLNREGLNYGFLPKALLKFHKVAGGSAHTPLEEHLEEGAQYAADKDKKVKIHFTVSHEHRGDFDRLLKDKLSFYEKVWGVNFDVTMSEQAASTDTLAVNQDNTPYRNENGDLLFRPAGHGALIKNLNERSADVVFIKNIDNVVPSKLRYTTTQYKKAIAGYLIKTQKSIAKYLKELEKENVSREDLNGMLSFLENVLCTCNEATGTMQDAALQDYLRKKFNRPIRVCGVVKNEGEPGGGPYLAYNNDGSYSPQILEAAQIDQGNSAHVALMNASTHFNPVDLVCYLKDYRGDKFDLKKYIDLDTGLISGKSVNGVDIKALELPGLWNGTMSDWNTVFVEVPIDTFNPVKTVNDLLRKEHQ